MGSVAAPDRWSELVLDRPPLDRLEQCVEIVEQDVARARQLHREAGVEHVRTRHPLMHEARGFADMLGDVGEEGDDVVLHLDLDREIGRASCRESMCKYV